MQAISTETFGEHNEIAIHPSCGGELVVGLLEASGYRFGTEYPGKLSDKRVANGLENALISWGHQGGHLRECR